MELPSFIRESPEGTLLTLRMQPRASRDGFGDAHGDELKVRVMAPPVNSAANHALIRFLSKTLDIPRNRIMLVRGHKSRSKTVLVQDASSEEITVKMATVPYCKGADS